MTYDWQEECENTGGPQAASGAFTRDASIGPIRPIGPISKGQSAITSNWLISLNIR